MWFFGWEDTVTNDDERMKLPANASGTEQETLREAKAAYKTIFAMFYGFPATTPYKRYCDQGHFLSQPVNCADSLGCLPNVADKISSLILENPKESLQLAWIHPADMLAVACQLRSRGIYQEALRHCLRGGRTRMAKAGYSHPGDCTEDELDRVIEAAEVQVRTKQKYVCDGLMDLLSRGSPTEPEYTSNRLLTEALWRRWVQTTLSADDLFGETASQFRRLFMRELDVVEVVKESKEFWAKAHGLVAVDFSGAEQDLT
ncbi:hypothetical protein LTS18_006316 [Coniosporium uncinatum]|uniref:Uncharacterized protein n=1 Tax=Coniosporium uncinatum TaxID=93489 RepID=A0ACC3DQJ3_9PEZI|nr:hypothetical protein LTS18_006316 [Coniosporium uncinatum]